MSFWRAVVIFLSLSHRILKSSFGHLNAKDTEINIINCLLQLPRGLSGKKPPANAGDTGEEGSILVLGRSAEGGHATLSCILACRIHGQRTLTGYSPRDCRVGHDSASRQWPVVLARYFTYTAVQWMR